MQQASTDSFFFKDTSTTEIYTLSLHDALPIWGENESAQQGRGGEYGVHGLHGCAPSVNVAAQSGTPRRWCMTGLPHSPDRKSTRLNSSHSQISYAVFCLKKKKNRKRKKIDSMM